MDSCTLPSLSSASVRSPPQPLLCAPRSPADQFQRPGQICTSKRSSDLLLPLSSRAPPDQQQAESPRPDPAAPRQPPSRHQRASRPGRVQQATTVTAASPLLAEHHPSSSRSAATAANNSTWQHPDAPRSSAHGSERPPLLIHASPSSETGTVAFSSTLATLTYSPIARNRATTTATATRPATTSFPNVSVFSSSFDYSYLYASI